MCAERDVRLCAWVHPMTYRAEVMAEQGSGGEHGDREQNEYNARYFARAQDAAEYADADEDTGNRLEGAEDGRTGRADVLYRYGGKPETQGGGEECQPENIEPADCSGRYFECSFHNHRYGEYGYAEYQDVKNNFHR